MFAEVEYPQNLLPEKLDQFLAQGWFRMGQTIFTTNFLNFHNQFYSAIWLRVILPDWNDDRHFSKLSKINKSFRTKISPAVIDTEKETLYFRYKKGIEFDTSSSLDNLLLGSASQSIYNTYEITIYDGEKLIAVGFFDLGKESAAGITSFYDQDYKKYSLGRYLIYLKMEYCKKMGMHYFYPGYFVPDYSAFDYKLKIGTQALYFLHLKTQQWLPIDHVDSKNTPITVMREKLKEVQHHLMASNIAGRVMKYEFFSANLIPDLVGMELLDFPYFYQGGNESEEIPNPIVVYDVRDEMYHLLKCVSLWRSNVNPEDENLYSSHLLKIYQDIMATASAREMTEVYRSKLKEWSNIKFG